MNKTWFIKLLNNIDLSSGTWMGIYSLVMILTIIATFILISLHKISYNDIGSFLDWFKNLFVWVLAFFAGSHTISKVHKNIIDNKVQKNINNLQK